VVVQTVFKVPGRCEFGFLRTAGLDKDIFFHCRDLPKCLRTKADSGDLDGTRLVFRAKPDTRPGNIGKLRASNIHDSSHKPTKKQSGTVEMIECKGHLTKVVRAEWGVKYGFVTLPMTADIQPTTTTTTTFPINRDIFVHCSELADHFSDLGADGQVGEVAIEPIPCTFLVHACDPFRKDRFKATNVQPLGIPQP